MATVTITKGWRGQPERLRFLFPVLTWSVALGWAPDPLALSFSFPEMQWNGAPLSTSNSQQSQLSGRPDMQGWWDQRRRAHHIAAMSQRLGV